MHRGELTLYIKREALLEVALTLRDDPKLRFEMCSSVSGVDYPADPSGRRLHSVYHLLSMTHRRRFRLEVSVTFEDPHVPSVTDDLSDCELARAGDLGLLRHRLRRASRR